MNSTAHSEDLCDFVWQYEHRKRWHTFSDEEIRHLNDAVKQGQSSVILSSKKKKKSLDFNKMIQVHEVSFYEQRVRCLIGNSSLNVWLWKNDKDDWISYSPQFSFLLEMAYQKKEGKICCSDYELNLENFEQIHNETKDSHPIQRLVVNISYTEEIQAIIQKNEMIFKNLHSKDFSRVKRVFDSIPTVSNVSSTVTKKRRKEDRITDAAKNTIVPMKGISKIKDNLGVLKTAENGNFNNDLPVDKECPLLAGYHIYSESKSFSATLNQTNLQNNNNKFYFIQLLKHNEKDQYSVWRRWGRVGQRGQTNLNHYGTNLTEAKDEFEKKFYDKTKNHWDEDSKFVHVKGKYDLLQINLNPQKVIMKTDVQSRLSIELKALMELICDTRRMEEIMKEFSYDSNKTPLGELTLNQVKSGYTTLNRIATVLQKGGSHSELLNACNDFYTKIPHNFGMKTPPIIRTQADLDNKQEMLEALSNIQVAMDMMSSKAGITHTEHPLDKYYKTLKCSIELLEPDCPEYLAIEKCLQETHGPTHTTYKMEIINIFKCFKPQEESSFINHNTKLILWHGSRTINWLGILKEGLRIAPSEAPRTGYMFGKGIYFADVSTKSANYCYATKKKNEGLLLMCEVSVGKQLPLFKADEELPDTLPSDYNSVFGKGRVSPSDFQTGILSSEAQFPVGPLIENQDYNGSLHYNEYIVYNTKQVKMKYLVRLKFNFK